MVVIIYQDQRYSHPEGVPLCKETVAALFSLNPLGLHLKYFDAAAWLNIWAGAGGVFGIPEGVTRVPRCWIEAG